MIDFDPSEPAILHDRLSDTIEPWTGEEADDYRKHSIVHADGAVEWGGFMFDGWGNVLGGWRPCLLRRKMPAMDPAVKRWLKARGSTRDQDRYLRQEAWS